MKFPLPSDTFPPLALSKEDERRLESATEVIVQKTVQQYHELLTVHKGVVDEKRWKKIKTRDNLRAYTERRVTVNGDDDGTASNSSMTTEDERNNVKQTTSLLTVGSMPGTLDDIMYCVANPSVEDMMLKSAYIEDGFVDWAVLAKIISPSERDPFRTLTVKWSVKKNPRLVATVMRVRDMVYVESSGTAVTPSGERIGYLVYHSVAIPEIRVLSELHIMRLELSACLLVRQRDDKTVETYSRTLISPTGDVPTSLLAMHTADVALSVSKHVHCAEMKKLTRILTSRAQPSTSARFASETRGSLVSSSASSSLSSSDQQSTPTTCALCSQSLGGGRLSFASSSSKEKSCRICNERICSRCRVHKSLYLPAMSAEKQLTGVSVAFCTRCIHSAVVSTSSHTFAVLDVRAAQGKPVDYCESLKWALR
ncbi:hypothetical protein Gpo141_00003894 [Globisporangium polare]